MNLCRLERYLTDGVRVIRFTIYGLYAETQTGTLTRAGRVCHRQPRRQMSPQAAQAEYRRLLSAGWRPW
jgi:hypothetical protein